MMGGAPYEAPWMQGARSKRRSPKRSHSCGGQRSTASTSRNGQPSLSSSRTEAAAWERPRSVPEGALVLVFVVPGSDSHPHPHELVEAAGARVGEERGQIGTVVATRDAERLRSGVHHG